MRATLYRWIPTNVLTYVGDSARYVEWIYRGYSAPPPPAVKRRVLLRNALNDAVWIESGTYFGDTTFFLSKHANHVYSIELDERLAAQAKKRFRQRPNIEILQGDSGQLIGGLLTKISGNVNLWLDGHFSGGITCKGELTTPIVAELAAVSAYVKQTSNPATVVMIDDVRCFDPSIPDYRDYPDLSFLVQWAVSLHAKWHIEHDIFVADLTVRT
jgi:hypothetical protein